MWSLFNWRIILNTYKTAKNQKVSGKLLKKEMDFVAARVKPFK